jgi:signal transduction histidine kinase
MERVYTWPRRHPQLVDGALAAVLLAAVLLAGKAAASADRLTGLPWILALATIAVRRRYPVTAFATAIVVSTVRVATVPGPAVGTVAYQVRQELAAAAIILLLYTVAANRPRRVSVPSLACALLFTAAMTWQAPQAREMGGDPLQFLLTGSFIMLLAAVGAWVLGDSVAYRRASAAALEERAVRAERERDARAQVAAAAERARIARELHDVIAHNLSVMVAQADGGRYVFGAAPEQSRQALAQIGDTGRQALSEMSHLLGVLRNGDETPAFAPAPGAAEIAELVTQARESGMNVSYAAEGDARPLPAGLSLTVYRIVQEALTNVRKHAGRGAEAEVRLSYGADDLLIRITDDGSGSAAVPSARPSPDSADGPALLAANGGHGLAGMRERAAMYDGTVQAGARPGSGFQVTARLPLTAREAA